MIGSVVQLHTLGGIVRLESGDLANIALDDLARKRPVYERAFNAREQLTFDVRREGRRRIARLTPILEDDAFEARMGAFLAETESSQSDAGSEPTVRRFLRKKRGG